MATYQRLESNGGAFYFLGILSFMDPVQIITTYFCAIIGFMIGDILKIELFGLIFTAIPSLMDVLLVLTLVLRRGAQTDRPLYLNLAAMFMCFVSDVLLSLVPFNANLFLVGTGTFAVFHILLIIAFSSNGEPLNLKRCIPIYGILGIMLYYLFTQCGLTISSVFGIAIIIYGTLETSMVWRAVSRIGFNSSEENIYGQWVVAIGALLFLFSDCILITSKFCPDFPAGAIYGVYFMSLYYLGVFMIAIGADRFTNPFALFFNPKA
eukprot:Phypoly_transcript_13181.p1 GENE.Phypoly_transcript_13181~~Phypoly_transcript_13181.p1  ORF type:complete len:265 (+),score=21.40 Phypoly_transcript_13181:165-959(+)